jgi:predicted AlkP superfamily pyrophosphatase or phosphodiesterase
MRPLVYPDYQRSILNVTASLLKHYHVPISTPTLPLLDAELEKGYRNIVLWLVDGMGSSILSRLPVNASFLQKDKKTDITSVFPSTTSSATTSVLSGLSPQQTGWVGWSQYFPEESRTVILFTNQDFYQDEIVIDHPVAQKILAYPTIYSLIEQASPEVGTAEIFPAFRTPEIDTPAKMTQAILQKISASGRHFVYAYWDKLDTVEHQYGPSSSEALTMMEAVDAAYAGLIKDVPEGTLVIVIADHGQTDVLPIPLRKYQDVCDTFLHDPSVDARAAAFFIKPDQKKLFAERFNHHFRDHYVLIPSDRLVESGIFGIGTPHPRFRGFLGDFMAIAIDRHYFQLIDGIEPMKGHHAGLLSEEMLVPLILHAKP